ncbi:hypothetical protein AB0D32_22700 [Micromonospora sp. NPDC048170]|uniref:hypothetical protein n=1 Tax=Micromonospora sp. NPDC048170 TaxID=3154819 RepID=UPI0033E337DE
MWISTTTANLMINAENRGRAALAPAPGQASAHLAALGDGTAPVGLAERVAG